MAKIAEVIAEQTSSLMNLPGVIGIGQGESEGKECILVMVTHTSPEIETPKIEAAIPRTLGGYPVVVQDVGIIQAL